MRCALPCLALALVLTARPLELSATQAPTATPSVKLPSMPPFIDVALGASQAWVECEDCDAVELGTDLAGALRVGVQLPDRNLQLGADIIHYREGSRHFTTVGLNLTGLLAHGRVVAGASFGFAGFRTQARYVDILGTVDTATLNFWGLGFALHGGLMLPLSRVVSVTPRVTFATQLGHPIESSTAVPGGIVTVRANAYILAVLVGVQLRERQARLEPGRLSTTAAGSSEKRLAPALLPLEEP